MGIFEEELALREEATGNDPRHLPITISEGREYHFEKRGQLIYNLHEEIPLVMIHKDGRRSEPLAMIRVTETSHSLTENNAYTHGNYRVIKKLEE